jgi:hypothetical protein
MRVIVVAAALTTPPLIGGGRADHTALIVGAAHTPPLIGGGSVAADVIESETAPVPKQLALDDGLDDAHSEIGFAAFGTIANKGMSTAASFRLIASRMYSRVGFRAEYGVMGGGFHDIQRYGLIHRVAGTLRYRIPWYREKGTRVETHVDVGAGKQAVRWDDRTDWRNDVVIGAGVRLDCLRNMGDWIGTGYIGWGLGFAVMIAPNIRPHTIGRGVTVDGGDDDYDVGIMFTTEAVL